MTKWIGGDALEWAAHSRSSGGGASNWHFLVYIRIFPAHLLCATLLSVKKTRGGGQCFYTNHKWCNDVTVLAKKDSPDLESYAINCKPFCSWPHHRGRTYTPRLWSHHSQPNWSAENQWKCGKRDCMHSTDWDAFMTTSDNPDDCADSHLILHSCQDHPLL